MSSSYCKRAGLRFAGCFISHIREDGLTDTDFCQTEAEERIDNTACAACGLLELSTLVSGEEGEDCRAAALHLLPGTDTSLWMAKE